MKTTCSGIYQQKRSQAVDVQHVTQSCILAEHVLLISMIFYKTLIAEVMLLSRTYGADSVGIVLLDVGPDGGVHSAPPALQGAINVLRPGVTGLLPQVVELEGDLVLGVQNPAVPEVSMLCD